MRWRHPLAAATLLAAIVLTSCDAGTSSAPARSTWTPQATSTFGSAPPPAANTTPTPTPVSVPTAAAESTRPRAANAVYFEVGDNFFEPSTATANVGQDVVWFFEGANEHELSFGPCDGCPRLRFRQGGYSRNFGGPGVYPFTCLIHAEMRGTITVQ
jgi:plastocyanin